MSQIVKNNKVLGGKPHIQGTRMSVDIIGSFINSGYGVEEIKESYPHLSDDQISSALGYIEERTKAERGKIGKKNE